MRSPPIWRRSEVTHLGRCGAGLPASRIGYNDGTMCSSTRRTPAMFSAAMRDARSFLFGVVGGEPEMYERRSLTIMFGRPNLKPVFNLEPFLTHQARRAACRGDPRSLLCGRRKKYVSIRMRKCCCMRNEKGRRITRYRRNRRLAGPWKGLVLVVEVGPDRSGLLNANGGTAACPPPHHRSPDEGLYMKFCSTQTPSVAAAKAVPAPPPIVSNRIQMAAVAKESAARPPTS